jgi:predicted nucleotidyltransferase component of viral defense system
MLEKVSHLLALLDIIAQDDFLKTRVVLKGGTALNLFYFKLPRLSVDIDLNYTGSIDPETMKVERDQIERLLQGICGRLKLQLAKLPDEYACRKYTASYQSNFSGRGSVQLDINYLHRVNYWTPELKDSVTLHDLTVKNFPIISLPELTAGKMAALLARTASRDVFDITQIAGLISHAEPKLRVAYVLYGAKQPKDWRKVSVSALKIDLNEFTEKLIPVLRGDLAAHYSSPEKYAKELLEQSRIFVEPFFPLTTEESEFIHQVRDKGLIQPQLLTTDEELGNRIKSDPALLWRASKAGS